MSSLIQALETSKQTLINTQVQIQTTNNNISQADNTNYHRQKAEILNNPPTQYGRHYIGTGARIYRIQQEVERFVEQRLFDAVSKEAYFSTKSSYLETLSAFIFDDGDTAISNVLRDFWSSWNNLAVNPGDAEKATVKGTAEYLVETIRTTHDSLSTLNQNIDDELGETIDRVNSLLDTIAEYNRQIVRSEYPLDPDHPEIRETANSLRDMRYEAIKELASLLPISVEEQNNGSVTIWVTDMAGNPPVQTEIKLVYGDAGTEFGSLVHDGNGTFHYEGQPPGGSHILEGGKIGGLISSYNNVAQVMDNLNTFTSSLIDEVNTYHSSNTVFDGSDASDISVNDSFNPDPSLALYVSSLQDEQISSLDNLSFGKYLASTQHTIGLWQQNAEDRYSFYSSLVTEVQTQQQSISGVSLDEELVNLIKFQQIFQAAAKVITTVSDLMNTVVDMV